MSFYRPFQGMWCPLLTTFSINARLILKLVKYATAPLGGRVGTTPRVPGNVIQVALQEKQHEHKVLARITQNKHWRISAPHF